jgi:hypothetical protein
MNTGSTSTTDKEVVSSTAKLVNNNDDEEGESGIEFCNIEVGDVVSSTNTKRPKSSILMDGGLYWHYNYPNNNNSIHYMCKSKNVKVPLI